MSILKDKISMWNSNRQIRNLGGKVRENVISSLLDESKWEPVLGKIRGCTKYIGTAVIKPSYAEGEILWPVILLCYGMVISWCKSEFLASVNDKQEREWRTRPWRGSLRSEVAGWQWEDMKERGGWRSETHCASCQGGGWRKCREKQREIFGKYQMEQTISPLSGKEAGEKEKVKMLY